MDVLDLMMHISAVTLITVVCLLLFGDTTTKKNGLRRCECSNPIKRLWAKRRVRRWRKRQRKLEVSKAAELPRVSERLWDSLTFRSSAPDGTLLVLMLRQKQDSTADVLVHLALPDGTVYSLPEEQRAQAACEESAWGGGGVKMFVLEPFVRWRILFNGLLRQDGRQLVHARLNLIWTMASHPVRYPEDWSEELATASLAATAWDTWSRTLEENCIGGGFEQWGSLQGTLLIDESPEVVIRARGTRERWWSPLASPGATPQEGGTASRRALTSQDVREAPPLQTGRAVTLLATARDGNAVYLRSHEYEDQDGKIQTTSGSVRMSNCLVHSISSTDFDLAEFCGDGGEVPPAYTVRVTGSRPMTVVLEVESSKKIVRSRGLYGLETITVPVKLSIDGDPGYGVIELGYQSEHGVKWELYDSPTPQERLSWLSIDALPALERDSYCVDFSRPACTCPQLVGAKGASLALLSSSQSDQYCVPPGFCLTTHALDRQIARNPHLRRAIQDIVSVNREYSDAGLKAACERAVKLFSETPVCEEVRAEIAAQLAQLRRTVTDLRLVDDITFAVRSSAIGEDSEELSAAGQNDTVLGCRDESQVLLAVCRCWASLYSAHSTQYRRMHGQPVDTGMGVVTQCIVPARAAGVLFSRHPNTGHPTTILLTANHGLGESVVSGQVEPDTIILERLPNDDVQILSTEIGKKTHQIVVGSKGDTVEVALTEEESRKSCLTEEECKKLGRIAVSQEKLWGAPRDLEWAIYKNKIFLVQARPITSLERWTEYELLHEFDTPVMSEEDLFTFANTGEVLPGALSPLTISVVCSALLAGTYRAVNLEPLPQFPLRHPFLISHARCGLNMYNTMFRRLGKKIDAGTRVIEMAVHGHEVADERIHAIALKRNQDSVWERLATVLYMVKCLIGAKSSLEKCKRLVETYDIDKLLFEDPLSGLDAIESSLSTIEETLLLHNITTSASVFSQAVGMSILVEGAEQFTLEHLTDIGLMLSSCSDLVSAEVPNALAAIADGIYTSGLHQQFCELSPSECIPWLKEHCPTIHDKVQRFLKDHAHRNIKEFDLATKTWGIDPTSLLQSIQSAVKAQAMQPDKKENKVVLTNKQIAASVTSPKRSITRWLLPLVLPLCQRTVAHREGSKAYSILAIHKMRLAVMRLGALMTESWFLPDPDLVFFFTLQELREYLNTRDPAIIKKASQRRRRYPAWNSLKFAEMHEGHVIPLDGGAGAGGRAGSGAKLCGTPVCPGQALGRACVVTDLNQIGQLQSGDILVTHSTDIGWSPYFPLLGGVVTELGGLISHGAVIAREYGLPCIVGAEGATSFCATGDLVLLVGAAGTLEKIDPVDSQIDPADSQIDSVVKQHQNSLQS